MTASEKAAAKDELRKIHEELLGLRAERLGTRDAWAKTANADNNAAMIPNVVRMGEFALIYGDIALMVLTRMKELE